MPYYVLILSVFFLYSNVYDNVFLYDDQFLILQNSFLQTPHVFSKIFSSYVNAVAYRAGHFYRPLQNILYFLIYQVGGAIPFGFHLLNVCLHAANACLIYGLGRKLNFNAVASFAAALLWAVHPIHTEAVTYMSATADVLYSFFCLLGLLVLVPHFTPRRMVIASLCMFLGLLSKEAAVVFPMLAMVCFYVVSPKRFDPRLYGCTWPLWLLAAIYVLARYSFLPFDGKALMSIDPTSQFYAIHIMVRIHTCLAAIPAYLGLLLWPADLHMDRNFPVYVSPWYKQVFAGLFIILVAAIQTYQGHRHKKYALGWGFLWFAVSYAPETGILLPVNSLFLEHWMYLPTAGLFLGIGQTVAVSVKTPLAKKTSCLIVCFMAIVLGCKTYQQNTVWHDGVSFYMNILNHGETSARAHNNLGLAYMEDGNYQQAEQQFRLAMQPYDLMPEPHQGIAALLAKNLDGKTHIDEEITELKRSIQIRPDFISSYVSLADLYDYTGDKEQAAYYRNKANELRAEYISP